MPIPGRTSSSIYGQVLHELKAGRLHSGKGKGAKKGPKVTSKKQAKAIAASIARKRGAT